MTSLGYFNSTIETTKAGEPTKEQLDRINSRLDTPLKKTDIFVFPSNASNRSMDSYFSIMDDSSLKNYAEDYADGRAFMNGHRTNERPTGRTFDASFDENTGNVRVWTYVLRGIQINDTPTDDFVRAVEGGIINDVSIRFNGGDEVCGLCDNKLGSKRCVHIPGVEYEWEGKQRVAFYRILDAHAAELSDVYKGSTPRAGIIRKIRLMAKRGLISDIELRMLATKFRLKKRHLADIPGVDNLKFSFEKYNDADDDENDGVDPNTNLLKSQKMPDNYAEPHGNLDGRGQSMENYHKSLVELYTRKLEEQGATLDPAVVKDVRAAIEKWRAGEDADPPSLAMKKKKKEADDTSMDDDDKEDRYLKPKNVTFDSFIRALGSGDGKQPIALPNVSEMEPGKGHQAGMVMEGTDAPIANVASQMFQEIGAGSEIPTDADIIKGLTEINTPMLTINPSGAMFLLNSTGGGDGNTAVMDSSGSGLYIAGGRKVEDSKSMTSMDGTRCTPLTFRLDDPANVRALVSAAIDSANYRRALNTDLVRYGMIKDGKAFDKDFHLQIADTLSTTRLAKYVENMKLQASEKMRTHPQTDIKIDQAELVSTRQTVAVGNADEVDKTRSNGTDKEVKLIGESDEYFTS